MRVVVEYGLWLRERVGVEKEVIELAGSRRLRDLKNTLAVRHPVIERNIKKLVFLVDGRAARDDYELNDGCLVTVLPTVSGG